MYLTDDNKENKKASHEKCDIKQNLKRKTIDIV